MLLNIKEFNLKLEVENETINKARLEKGIENFLNEYQDNEDIFISESIREYGIEYLISILEDRFKIRFYTVD